jgi:hypothetical protein
LVSTEKQGYTRFIHICMYMCHKIGNTKTGFWRSFSSLHSRSSVRVEIFYFMMNIHIFFRQTSLMISFMFMIELEIINKCKQPGKSNNFRFLFIEKSALKLTSMNGFMLLCGWEVWKIYVHYIFYVILFCCCYTRPWEFSHFSIFLHFCRIRNCENIKIKCNWINFSIYSRVLSWHRRFILLFFTISNLLF